MSEALVSRVEADTVAYLDEVSTRYAALDDREEGRLLVSAVLEEIQGKELRVATDAATSRMLEVLLAGADAGQLMQFMQAFAEEDALYRLAGGAFGSHVAEKVLMGLDAQAPHLDEATAQQLQDLLGQLVGALGDQLYEYIMDKHATHVARRLLCVIVGRDVLPAGKKQKQQQPADPDHPEQHKQQQQQPKQGATKSALAEKMSGSSGSTGNQAPPARYPDLLRRYARMLPIYEVSGMSQLAKNQYSSPFLQAMLRAAASDRDLLMQLLPPVLGAQPAAAAAAEPGSRLITIADSHVGKLMRDECYSRVLEVVMAVAPADIFEEIYTRFLKGRLLPLTSHHSANFVVQSMFAACSTPQQFAPLFAEISPYLGDLLKRRRSGVLATAAAAAGRVGCNQAEVARAIAAAVSQLAQWAGRAGTDHLAPALLTLDTDTVLNSSSSNSRGAPGGRLSTPGCAVLATLLQYVPPASQDYIQSLLSLQPAALAHVAADPSGSRVIEALLLGPAPVAAKEQLMQQMQGQWAQVAMSAAGSFVVEKAFDWADLDGKEAIVADVATKAAALTQHCYWGTRLSSRLGLEAHQRNPEEWRKRTQTAAATRAAFSQLFGAQPGQQAPAAGGALSKRELRRQRKARKLQKLQGAEQQQQGDKEEEEDGQADADDAPEPMGQDVDDQQQQQQQQQGEGEEQQHKGSAKKRKHLADDTPAAEAPGGKPGKKSKKPKDAGADDLQVVDPEQQHFLGLLGFGTGAAAGSSQPMQQQQASGEAAAQRSEKGTKKKAKGAQQQQPSGAPVQAADQAAAEAVAVMAADEAPRLLKKQRKQQQQQQQQQEPQQPAGDPQHKKKKKKHKQAAS